MLKRWLSIFLATCLSCGLTPVHAASMQETPSQNYILISEKDLSLPTELEDREVEQPKKLDFGKDDFSLSPEAITEEAIEDVENTLEKTEDTVEEGAEEESIPEKTDDNDREQPEELDSETETSPSSPDTTVEEEREEENIPDKTEDNEKEQSNKLDSEKDIPQSSPDTTVEEEAEKNTSEELEDEKDVPQPPLEPSIEGKIEEEDVLSEKLELEKEIEPLPGSQGRVGREEIQIQTKQELIDLLNRELVSSVGVQGDFRRYGINNADIYLNEDITISSDDINAQLPGNTLYSNYENSFSLQNSNFYGNGHTITIEQGQRRLYPLFGNLLATNDFIGTVSELSIVYRGDVCGAGFAQGIYQRNNFYGTNFQIQDINITVEGNILPYSTSYWTQNDNTHNTVAEAAGFAFRVDGTSVENVNIYVEGNIGSLNPEPYEHAETELIFGRSSGFSLDRTLRGHESLDSEKMQNIQDVTIQIGGSILAAGHHFRAEAIGLGYDMQEKKYHDITLRVGGDIKAVSEGDSLFDKPYSYIHDPLLACATGHDLHHIEDAVFTIQGSIIAENHSNLGMDTHAMGLGDWDYLNDMSDSFLQKYPFTIQNVILTVGGDIHAESTTPEYEIGADGIDTVACAGMFNNMSGGLENYDTFQNNHIQVSGDVSAEGQTGTSFAMFWGYFMGEDNQFFANTLTASSIKGKVIVAPFYHFVKGARNTVSLADGIYAQGDGGSAAGFAITTTQFDGAADQNNIEVKTIQTDGLNNIGGFAVSTGKHDNQPQIDVMIQNIDLVFDKVILEGSKKKAVVGGFIANNSGAIKNCTVTCRDFSSSADDTQYIGGFVGRNNGKGNISDSKVNMEGLKITGFGSIGGFVGENRGTIDVSCANLSDITVYGDPQTMTGNNQSIGGFEGYGYGGQIMNSAVFIRDSITASNGNYVNLGGFSGLSSEEDHQNNAAQIGENLSSIDNAGVVTIGGYAGKLWSVYSSKMSVERSTVLVFGNLEGTSISKNNPSLVGGFAGVLQGRGGDSSTAIITDSACFVGGKKHMASPIAGGEAAAVGILYDGTLSGFTVLGTMMKDMPENGIAPEQYLTLMSPASQVRNNFFVEVKGNSRIAAPITVSKDGDFLQGAEIGRVDIAARTLQKDYWGKDAASEKITAPYADFAYVTQKSNGITLQAISNGAGTISSGAFATASIPDFYTRHLALWSGTVGTPGPVYDILGIADMTELPDVIEVIPKDPTKPFHPEIPDDFNNNQTTPIGYVRVVFLAGANGKFGKYDMDVDKVKVAYDVKQDKTWAAVPVPTPIAQNGYQVLDGTKRWTPELPNNTTKVTGGTYTAQYQKQSSDKILWYDEVYLQEGDGIFHRWLYETGGKSKPDDIVSIDTTMFDGKKTAWGATLGIEYVFDANNTQNRLRDTAINVGRVNPLRIYYKCAPHTVTYQYEGDVPVGAPPVPEKVESWYSANVQISNMPTLAGYRFSGWMTDAEGAVVDKGVLTMPNADVVLKGSWEKVDTATVTFHVSNGTWKDGTVADKQVIIVLTDDKGTLNIDSIPTGMKANKGYKSGKWDKEPDTAIGAVTGNIVYTYSFRKDSSHGGNSGDSESTQYTLTYISNGGTEYEDERYRLGTTVKLNKTPERGGYTFTGWYADKKLTHAINKIKMNGNKTVYAGWEKEEKLYIPDMLNGDDHFAYVEGYTDGTVRPNNKITRAEVAMIFYRLLEEDVRNTNKINTNTFSDVTEEMWFNTAISTIAKLGIVSGRSMDIFDPNAPITRAEFAAICARFDHSDIEFSGHFSDVEQHWAKNAIERATALGWVSGYTDQTFRPDNYITRAEAMAMINRVLGRLPETKYDLLPRMKAWPDNADPDVWYYITVQEATNSHTFERKTDGVHEIWKKLK